MSTPEDSILGSGSHYNLDEISLFDMSLEDDCLIPVAGKKEPAAKASFPQQYIPETKFLDTRSMMSSLPVIQENAVSNIAEEAHLNNVSQMDCDANEETLPKKKKKKAGVNLRKSLAWNNAFLTEEGVLDTEELSLVNPTFHLQPEQTKQNTVVQQQQVQSNHHQQQVQHNHHHKQMQPNLHQQQVQHNHHQQQVQHNHHQQQMQHNHHQQQVQHNHHQQQVQHNHNQQQMRHNHHQQHVPVNHHQQQAPPNHLQQQAQHNHHQQQLQHIHHQQPIEHTSHSLQQKQVQNIQHLHKLQHVPSVAEQQVQPDQNLQQQQTPVFSSKQPKSAVLSKVKSSFIPSIKSTGTPTVESQQSQLFSSVRSSVDFSGYKRLEFNNGPGDEVISKRLSIHPLLSNKHANLLKKEASAHSEPLNLNQTCQKGMPLSGPKDAVPSSDPLQGKALSQLKPPTLDVSKQARQSPAAMNQGLMVLKPDSLKRPSQFENTENPKKPSHADGFGRLSKPSGLRMPSPKLGFFETAKGGSPAPNESVPVRSASGLKAPSMSVKSRQTSDKPASNPRSIRASSTAIPTIPANRTADVRLSRSLLNMPTKDSSGQILQVKNSIPSFSASTKSAYTRDIAGQENLYPDGHKMAGDQNPKEFSNNRSLKTFQYQDNTR